MWCIIKGKTSLFFLILIYLLSIYCLTHPIQQLTNHQLSSSFVQSISKQLYLYNKLLVVMQHGSSQLTS